MPEFNTVNNFELVLHDTGLPVIPDTAIETTTTEVPVQNAPESDVDYAEAVVISFCAITFGALVYGIRTSAKFLRNNN